MIHLKKLSLRRGSRLLLEGVDWTIFPGQHIGLTGANGSGKSSLFALLRGELVPDAGELVLPARATLAHVAQEMPETNQSAIEFVMDGDRELRAIQQRLAEAEALEDGLAMAAAHDALATIDAFGAPARAGRLLSGLGFAAPTHHQPVRAFSGGWQMRLLLAQALMCRSDILLLDEPTNHLDLDAVIWLSHWLRGYQGTLVMISHDRDFLDETVQHIAHIEQAKLETCTGNYSFFERQRAEKRLQQDAAWRQQQQKIASLQGFIERFRAKASKARQAQSRMKALERMEVIAAVQQDSPFQFAFRAPAACPRPLLQLERVTLAYGSRVVLSDLSLSIHPGDRIALIGPNGAGKTSLIRALAGELPLASGERQAGRGLNIGYFAQHHIDHLEPDETPLEHLAALTPESAERELRGWLGSFGFSGDRVKEPVRIFSGGEKSRLALSLIVWRNPNLLLLDEPTNHLDMAMRDALGLALQSFQGAVILVSHDRFLVRSTADQLVLVAEGQARPFEGDLESYEAWLTDFRRQQREETPAKSVVQKKQRPLDIRRLEARMQKLSADLAAEETLLMDPKLHEWSQRERLQEAVQRCETLRRELAVVEEAWLNAME